MNRCKKCWMPDTRPGSIFVDGVCQACINHEASLKIDRKERIEELKQWCKTKPRCLVAVSGGKDSHFITHFLLVSGVKEIVLINVTCPFTKTSTGIYNLQNLQNEFGLSLIRFTFSQKYLVEKSREDFEKTGEPLKFLEKQIYSQPKTFGAVLKLPVVFGDDPGWAYGNKTSEHKPTDRFAYMGYFIPWDYSGKYMPLVRELGFLNLGDEWQRNGYIEDYEQIDSLGYMIHLWLKYPKFGYQRTTDMVSRRIRWGAMTLEEGKKLIEENDYKIDPKALKDFCEILGYTENEFWEITERYNYSKVDLEKTKQQLWSMIGKDSSAMITQNAI